jgi:maltose phosphorylase
VHSILAAKLGRLEQAYEFYLRTARLDLDDYNDEVHEGLHITSMAGTWMSVIEGFGGMRIKNGQLQFSPQLPEKWEGYEFQIRFRENILHLSVSKTGVSLENITGNQIIVKVNNQDYVIDKNAKVEIS